MTVERKTSSVTLWLILFAIGAQIWLGTLLLLDSPHGPLMKFN